MKKRLFACFMMFVVLWNVQMSAYAQAQIVAKPFTGYVNQAIAGVVIKYAIRRGFAANDPRIALTMQAVGKVVDASVNSGALVDSALVIAGAPVWATAALGLATAGVIAFGVYKIYKSMSTDPNTGQQVETVKVVDTTKSIAAQTADPVAYSKSDFVSTTLPPKVPTTPVTGGKLSLVHYRNPSCDATVNSSCAAYPVSPPSRYFYQVSSTDGFPFNTAADWLFIQYVLICGAASDCTPSWTVNPTIDSTTGVISGTYKITYTTKDANGNPSGTASTGGTVCGCLRSDVNALGAFYGHDLGNLFDQLPSAAHSAVMTPDAMADIVSNAMIQAASDPAYQGLPYSVTNPVSAADVAAWQADVPGRTLPMVSFEAAVEPAGETAVTIAPNVSAANPHAVDTSPLAPASNVNVVNTPNVNVVNKISVDFGPSPGISEPQLATPPTAAIIFKPVMDSVKSFALYTVPNHPSECPKPKFEIFDKVILMDGHCTLLDSVKPTLFSIMAVVWIVLAIIIVLGA